MKTAIAMALALMASAPALAGNGPYERYPYYSTSVNCSDIKSALARAGAMVIHRAPGLYDLYAHHEGYCESEQRGQLSNLPTKDGQCRVIKCVQSSR